MNNRKWFYEAEQQGGDQGGAGGGAAAINPADARAFVSDFVPDPTSLAAMPDDQVVKYHGQLTGALQKHGPKAVPFGDKWREHIAGGDEKELARLQRFAAPTDVWKSYRAVEQKMSTGELKAATPFPAKGTDEQKAAWRKEQGLPDKPEGYDTNLGDGVVLGDDDKPLVDAFLKFAHDKNMPPAAVKDTLKWYLSEYRTETEQKKSETFKQLQKSTEDTLRTEWGGDYRGNRGAIDQLLDGRVNPDSDLKELIVRAVDTNAEFAKLLAGVALELNPAATLVPASGGDQSKTVDDEIGKIETFMRNNRAAYNRDEKMQLRLRTLYDARERMKSRQAA